VLSVALTLSPNLTYEYVVLLTAGTSGAESEFINDDAVDTVSIASVLACVFIIISLSINSALYVGLKPIILFIAITISPYVILPVASNEKIIPSILNSYSSSSTKLDTSVALTFKPKP